jgi:hypothetical protein
MNNCANCLHYHPAKGSLGLCKRYPPETVMAYDLPDWTSSSPFNVGNQRVIARFPIVPQEEVCGEHKVGGLEVQE